MVIRRLLGLALLLAHCGIYGLAVWKYADNDTNQARRRLLMTSSTIGVSQIGEDVLFDVSQYFPENHQFVNMIGLPRGKFVTALTLLGSKLLFHT